MGSSKIFIDFCIDLLPLKNVSGRSLPNFSLVSFFRLSVDLGWLVKQLNPSGYWQVVTGGELGQIISFYLGFFPFMILFCLGLAFS